MVGTPEDIEILKAALAAERAARLAAEAKVSSIDAMIAPLKLQIEKLRRVLYGQRSERKAKLLDQMELEPGELEASATEDELEAEMAAAETAEVKAFRRKKPSKKPFPEHLADFAGVLQADAYSGFNPLLDPERAPGPITPALCWAHSRRKFFELADLKKQLQISPMALEAVKRILERFSTKRSRRQSTPPPGHP